MIKLKSWLYAILFVSISLTTVLPHSAQANSLLCKKLFAAEALAYIPGFKLPTEIAKPKSLKEKCFGGGAIRGCRINEREYIEYYANGILLGQVEYSVHKDQSLWIYEYQVHSKARGQGISTKLLQEILLQYPSITQVSGQLAYTNFKAILDEYYAISMPGSRRYIKNLTRSDANILALQASPFAKALASLGFANVTRADLDWVFITSF